MPLFQPEDRRHNEQHTRAPDNKVAIRAMVAIPSSPAEHTAWLVGNWAGSYIYRIVHLQRSSALAIRSKDATGSNAAALLRDCHATLRTGRRNHRPDRCDTRRAVVDGVAHDAARLDGHLPGNGGIPRPALGIGGFA
jgi:hypothetical protein